MAFRILIAEPEDFSAEAVDLLRQAGEVVLQPWPLADLPRAFAEFDVVWFRLAHRIDASVIGPNPRCRWLATPVTGIDHIDAEACRRHGIGILCLKGETEFLRTVRATAELTIGLLLALLRHIPEASGHVRAGGWNRDLFRGSELYGKTAGIVGVGRLGSIVAGYLRAFGMTVIGYDPRPDFPADCCDRVASLDELMARSDVVSLHVSYGEGTRHLIGAPQLARMKPSAVLVNTSRGGVLDEAALLAALSERRLAGAALDVLDGEPAIDHSHPLVQALAGERRLLIVPHIGGNTRESFVKTEMFLANKLLRALAA